MKHCFLLLILCSAVSLFAALAPVNEKGERHIVLVSASYNNEQWCEKNLQSVFDQNYSNYHLIYINDCSTDHTLEVVTRIVDERDLQDKITIINNPVRRGAMANQYYA